MAGWEPRTVVTYRYDDAGRLVEAVTETEPEWSDEDRAWAAALDLVEARSCPSCGGPRSECRGEDKTGRFAGAHEICAKTWVAATHQKSVLDGRESLPASAVHAYAIEREAYRG